MNMRLTPLKIAILYAVIGGLWILFSDTALMAVVKDPETFTRVAIMKGWLYVIVTACLLYWLISRYVSKTQKSDKNLLESEQYNRALFERSVIGLALCRMDGSLVDVNEAYAKIIGRTVDETLRLTYWEITPEKYATQEQEQIESLRTSGHYGPYEKEYIHKDGHLVPVRLQGLLIEHGGKQCIWSSVEDITERKRAEDALRESETMLRNFFDSQGVMRGIVEVVAEDDVRHIADNAVTAGFIGLTPEAMKNKLGSELGEPKEILRKWVGFYKQSFSARKPVSFEYMDKRGEKEAWLSTTVSYLDTGTNGNPRFVYVISDITERKKAEEERQLFFSLANNSKEFIGIADLNFTPFYANAAALKLVGLPDLEAVRKIKVQDVFFPEDQLFITNEFLPRVLREGNREVEIRFRHFQTGEAIWMLYNVFAIHDMRGELAGWATVSRDITERKKAEDEIRKLNAELEQRVKGRTKELEAKIAEIEKMNRLFVGRELRMVELKETIKELESRIQ